MAVWEMDIGISDRGGGALSVLEAARRDAHARVPRKGQSLELILRVSGASPDGATVDGLLWLINDGVLLEGSCCWTTAWTRKQEKSPGIYRWDKGM